MAFYTKTQIEECEAEELLSELRKREGELYTDSKEKDSRPFANVDSDSIYKALIRTQKVIYGLDDRQEVYQVSDPEVQKRADTVVSLIDARSIEDNGDGTSTIRTVPYKKEFDLCPSERFAEQPVAPHCSGFLVTEDIIATAGHCINNHNLPKTRFVFGFRMIDDREARKVVPNENIFKGVSIVVSTEESSGADFALVKLDRPASNRPIAEIRRTGKIGDEDAVYVIGHPSGLPLKFASGAHVRNNSPASFFVANLDTYGGNSGSPVFNQKTGIVEGILVRGDTDFLNIDGCYRSNVCPTTGCNGEDVTRTTEFEQYVPRASQPLSLTLESRVITLEETIREIATDIKTIKSKI
ncbi:MAG: trypsin-like peptidase domain-containing protein [Bacteroidota bacterium]